MSRSVLRRPWQFRLVYQDGKKVSCKYSVLFYHDKRDPDGGPLFGFVASKRVGGAVQRNRAKRLLREAVRATENRLIRRDLWIVLVAKKSVLGCTSRDVTRDLQQGLAGEGLLRGEASS